jgi:hypothetical protein
MHLFTNFLLSLWIKRPCKVFYRLLSKIKKYFVATIATIPDGLSGKCRKYPAHTGWQAQCRGPRAAGNSTLHILENHVVIGVISPKLLCGTRCFLLVYWLNSWFLLVSSSVDYVLRRAASVAVNYTQIYNHSIFRISSSTPIWLASLWKLLKCVQEHNFRFFDKPWRFLNRLREWYTVIWQNSAMIQWI